MFCGNNLKFYLNIYGYRYEALKCWLTSNIITGHFYNIMPLLYRDNMKLSVIIR